MKLTDDQFKLVVYNKLVKETYKTFVFTNKKKYIWFRKWFLSVAKRKTDRRKIENEKSYQHLVQVFNIRYEPGTTPESKQELLQVRKEMYQLTNGLSKNQCS